MSGLENVDAQSLILLATAQAAEQGVAPGFIGTLGLNWKLFLAQLVNFGIVVFVLWKWVMKPVVGALEGRRQRVEASVKKAEEIENRMKQFEQEREERVSRAKMDAEAIVKKAVTAAETVKQETTEQARAESAKILAETKAAVEAEKQQMLQEIREEVGSLTVMATEKILREKLDSAKDRELVSEILKDL